MTAALPAFLLESVFYLGAGFESTRNWFARLRPARTQAWFLWMSALLPYIIYSFGAGTFQRNAFYVLAGLVAVLVFWWAIFPRRLAYDVGFLFLAAAPIVMRVFQRIYQSPDEHVHLDILGHIMWIRLGIITLLVMREWDPGSFSFWPKADEWKEGALAFLIALVPLVALALGLHDVEFGVTHGEWWQVAGIAVATFFGMLWVVAFGEELFFRGVILQAFYNNWRPPLISILVSAILYGMSHLWFHQFPNWRRTAVTIVLGIACGVAYVRTGSVRASMVTHALAATTWRLFFK
jgi:membrane protease YdiL (CAAX protease family)